MWGTLGFANLKFGRIRFIPTDVGNAKDNLVFKQAKAVHPHGCGERFKNGIEGMGIGGSSPRMWGTLRQLKPGALIGRFIPTDVGNA